MQETVMSVRLLAAFGVQLPVFLLEFLNTAGGVDKLLLAGEEGVACGADLHSHIARCTPHLKGVAASTYDRSERIFRMNITFHFNPLAQFFQRFFKQINAFQKYRLISGVGESDVTLRTEAGTGYSYRSGAVQNIIT